VYDLPPELGEFDVAFFGMILSHLRDPFQALYGAARLCRETLIVTNQVIGEFARPGMAFSPDKRMKDRMVWWAFTPRCLEQMLQVLGFEVRKTIKCTAKCTAPGHPATEICQSFVAYRVAGTTCLDRPAKWRAEAA
jgi:hypothetical protein